jgi:hypothetical protein
VQAAGERPEEPRLWQQLLVLLVELLAAFALLLIVFLTVGAFCTLRA